jgi:hypothetical protein
MNNGGFNKLNNFRYPEQTEVRRQYDPRKDNRNMPIGMVKNEKHQQKRSCGLTSAVSSQVPNSYSLCFQCGQVGHFKRNCPNLVCFYCGKKGHVKKCCSFYSSYLQTRSSSTSLASTISNVTIKELVKVKEEDRAPQKIDNFLEKKVYHEYVEKTDKTIKSLEAAIEQLKKLLTSQQSQVQDLLKNVPAIMSMEKDIHSKMSKLTDHVLHLDSQIDILTSQMNIIQEGMDYNGLAFPEISMGNRGKSRGRGGFR